MIQQTTLTTLPLSIQTRILRYLCPHYSFLTRTNRWKEPYWLPFNDPPVEFSLFGGDLLTVQLPSELIPPALASPILAAAAAHLLGDRVSYLTHCNTGDQLVAWIKAFAPYVKAVSTNDPFPAWWIQDLTGTDAKYWLSAPEIHFEHSVQLFKTLSIHDVTLEVLDLLNVHFLDSSYDVQDDFMAGLCATLASNSTTLRELALPVFSTSDICDKALEMSTLKKLQVLTVKLWDLFVENESEPLPPPFLRMIRAVDGHADRSRKLTTLRELRLFNVLTLGGDCVTPSDRTATVFLSIKTLRINMNHLADYSREAMRFIFLFKNLECLFWSLNPTPDDELFKILCAKVPEVHLSWAHWITRSVQVGNKRHFTGTGTLFDNRSSDTNFELGAIRSFLAGAVSRAYLRNMMKHCPSLENLSVHVTRENMRAVRKLVLKCQQMKCLELVFDERRHGRFDAEDWRSLSQAIPKSHKNLCQLAIQTVNHEAKATTCTGAVLDCFEAVAKALGARARRLAFRAKFRSRQGVRIMERVCGLLNICIQHTTALESLELKLQVYKADVSDYDGDWEQEVLRRLARMENRLLRAVQSLRMLDLGISPWSRQHIDWNHDTLEECSMVSERESATL